MSELSANPWPLPSAVFFDLVGTLVDAEPWGNEPADGKDVRLLPRLRETVDHLPGVPLFIVTNESEAASRPAEAGAVEECFAAVHRHLDGRITAARCCPHPPGAGCPGRKPAPGLLLELAAAHQIDLARAWYVGDSLEDRECARRAGIGQFHWAQTFFAPCPNWVLGVRYWVLGKDGPVRSQHLTPNTQHLTPTIRRATEVDLPAVVRIYNEAIEERISTCDLDLVTVAARRPWFERFDERHPLHLAVVDGEVVGWSAILPYDPKPGYAGAVEHSIYVDRAARGAGLGRRLLEHLLETAAASGHRCMLGRIFRHNDPSLVLHHRLGFEEVGTLPRIARLDSRPADVVLMLRHL